ncbi:MAG: hypothetical protein BWY76_00901 [bacterium ADurb.Bin429]|nr:MAG: hypothetical protein BWY76_00901 [bacterium ADurb.Bin429]
MTADLNVEETTLSANPTWALRTTSKDVDIAPRHNQGFVGACMDGHVEHAVVKDGDPTNVMSAIGQKGWQLAGGGGTPWAVLQPMTETAAGATLDLSAFGVDGYWQTVASGYGIFMKKAPSYVDAATFVMKSYGASDGGTHIETDNPPQTAPGTFWDGGDSWPNGGSIKVAAGVTTGYCFTPKVNGTGFKTQGAQLNIKVNDNAVHVVTFGLNRHGTLGAGAILTADITDDADPARKVTTNCVLITGGKYWARLSFMAADPAGGNFTLRFYANSQNAAGGVTCMLFDTP